MGIELVFAGALCGLPRGLCGDPFEATFTSFSVLLRLAGRVRHPPGGHPAHLSPVVQECGWQLQLQPRLRELRHGSIQGNLHAHPHHVQGKRDLCDNFGEAVRDDAKDANGLAFTYFCFV